MVVPLTPPVEVLENVTEVAVAAPIFGVTSVGEVSITNLVPVPVWEAIAVAFPVDVIGPVKFALVATVVAVAALPDILIPAVPALIFAGVKLVKDAPETAPKEPDHVPDVIVPTEVRDDATTFDARVVPVSVPAAAATVIGDAPVKVTPLIAAPGVNADAVEAFPVNAPTKVVAVAVVNVAAVGVTPPMTTLLSVPPTMAGDVNSLLVSVCVAVSVQIVSLLIVPDAADKEVKAPEEGVILPINVLSIVPPVISTCSGLNPLK